MTEEHAQDLTAAFTEERRGYELRKLAASEQLKSATDVVAKANAQSVVDTMTDRIAAVDARLAALAPRPKAPAQKPGSTTKKPAAKKPPAKKVTTKKAATKASKKA